MDFIEIAGIGKTFGTFQALDAVDLSVEEREFITLLGRRPVRNRAGIGVDVGLALHLLSPTRRAASPRSRS